MEANFSGGTSANVYGGSVKTNERAKNREITFTVLCTASAKDNAAPQSLANRLVTLIAKAGDEAASVWFEWTLTPGLPEPIWGQFGVWRRAEIKHGSAQYVTQLGQYSRNEIVKIMVTLTVAPFALGTRNILATGGAYELDYFGSSAFVQTGIRSCEACTNLITNPVFENRTSWYTGWTAANLSLYENIEPDYVYPGFERSALLVCSATAGTMVTAITSSSTASDLWFSAYVKRPDGAAVTSADCEVWDVVAPTTTTYTLLGNGVYRATAHATPVAVGAYETGLHVKPSRSIYLLAMQAEQNTQHWTPLAVGDVYPATFSGAAHASSSVRADGRALSFSLRENDAQSNCSMAIVWKPDYPSTATGDRYLAYEVLGFSFYFNATDDKFYLTDATTTISTAAQTFAAGDTLRLYITMGNAGLDIYVNGSNAATSATGFTVSPGVITTVHAGSAASVGPGGIFKLYEFYDSKLTAAQITAIDTAIVAMAGNDNIDCPQVIGSVSIAQFPATTSPRPYAIVDALCGSASPVLDLESIVNASTTAIDTEIKLSILDRSRTVFYPTGILRLAQHGR